MLLLSMEKDEDAQERKDSNSIIFTPSLFPQSSLSPTTLFPPFFSIKEQVSYAHTILSSVFNFTHTRFYFHRKEEIFHHHHFSFQSLSLSSFHPTCQIHKFRSFSSLPQILSDHKLDPRSYT